MTKIKHASSDKVLIFENKEGIKETEETLKQIFSEIEAVKPMFDELDIPHSRATIKRFLQSGSEFIVDTLHSRLTSAYKGVAPTIINELIGDKEKIRPHVQPIQESYKRIRNLCSLLKLDPGSIEIETDGTPLMSDGLKKHIVEINRIYIETPEDKELFSLVQQFIEVSNLLEKCLKKNDHPLMFTDSLSFIPLNCYEFSAEHYEETGVWELVLNPSVFEFLKNIKSAKKFNAENYVTPLPTFENNRSTDVVVTQQWSKKQNRWEGLSGA